MNAFLFLAKLHINAMSLESTISPAIPLLWEHEMPVELQLIGITKWTHYESYIREEKKA